MLRTMLDRFPWFADMIGNVEIGLAKSDLSIARLYAGLVQTTACVTAHSSSSGGIRAYARSGPQHHRQSHLLENNPVLSRSIRLRNPYVDAMSLIQVELLRRKRDGKILPN